MAERSCWACLRFGDCDKLRNESRKHQLWNLSYDFLDFYRSIAEECEGWTESDLIAAQVLANELIEKIFQAVKQGKVVAVKNGARSFDFYGEYESEADARSSVNGDNDIVLLKAVPGNDSCFS